MSRCFARIIEYLRFLLLKPSELAKAPAWLQEKFQDEFEWQAQYAQSKQAYDYPSRPLLRATEAPVADTLLRPIGGAEAFSPEQLLRAGTEPDEAK